MIEMNMDCKEFLPELAEFMGIDISVINQFYRDHPDYARWGGGTVEPAVAQMLYILVRSIEPRTALEFGTNLGYSTAFMAAGLRDNNDGVLLTWDIDRAFTLEATRRIANLDLSEFVEFYVGSSTIDVEPMLRRDDVQPDLVFIDSSHQTLATQQEIELCLKFMKNGYLLFHDALAPESGVTPVLDKIGEDGIHDMLRLPTQPNTGFGVLRVSKGSGFS